MSGKALAALAVAVMATACGGGGYGGAKSGGTPTSTAAVTGTQVDVTETEYKIALSRSTFTPGVYTFVVHDAGHSTHALEIDGPGVEDKKSSYLDAGGTASMTVTLQKGTYHVYCPVANHADMGMTTTITVA